MGVTTAALPTAALLLLLSTGVAAERDPASTCVGGYEPSALVNVCYKFAPGNPGSPPGTGHTGTVGVAEGPCVIGNTCLPVPYHDPNGGVSYPTPGRPGTPGLLVLSSTYVEVLGNELYPQPTAGGFCVAQGANEVCAGPCYENIPDEESCFGIIVNDRAIVAFGSYPEDWNDPENSPNCIFVHAGQGPNGVGYNTCNPPELSET